jgi:hypothetical protein
MKYQKPLERKGLICHFVKWDRDGRIREAQYRKPERRQLDEADQGRLI